MRIWIVSALCPGLVGASLASVTVSGELKKWHKVTLRCEGPHSGETQATNPFTSFRLNARFHHAASGKTYLVPGYYAADGNAAETSADQGNVWHVHFAPDETGTWEYRLSFRQGDGVAVDPAVNAGTPAGHFDGAAGSFAVLPTDKTGRDLRGKGRLQYVGKHHLRFAETGEFFLKCGTDSPENLLDYDDIDGTPNVGNRRKSWAPHAGDYLAAEAASFAWQDPGVEGVPPKGSELLGAVRYLSDQGLNAFSFLTFSLDGDDDNVFPHRIIGTVDGFLSGGDDTRWSKVHHDRFDVSKLDQWERVLAYGTMKGMHLHFKTQETENDQKLDGGALGPERKLYYRELVARFGHHPALNWNLGEENTNSESERKAFAQWFHDHDPYRHPVVMHSYDSNQGVYTPLLGNGSKLTGVSLQPNDDVEFDTVFPESKRWVDDSRQAGKPWVVACDEPGDSSDGLRAGTAQPGNHANARKNALWGIAMAGGAGLEWYFGNNGDNPGASDISCQDFRSRETFWPVCKHLLDFWPLAGAPFWEMTNADALVSGSGNHCLARAGECYVIQLKAGGISTLNLSGAAGTFDVHWYDPRNGGALQGGSVGSVAGGGVVSLGSPPSSLPPPADDWIVLVRKATANTPPVFPGIALATAYQTVAAIRTPKLLFTVSDADGHAVTLDPPGAATARGGSLVLDGATLHYTPAAGFSGQDVFFLTVTDELGAKATAMVSAIVGPPPQLGSAGVNPPRLEIDAGQVNVRFTAIPGLGYRVQRSTDLLVWETLGTVTADPSGTVLHADADPPAGAAFYRLLPP